MMPAQLLLSRVMIALLIGVLFLESGARIYIRVWAHKPFQSLSPYIAHPDGGYWNNPRYTHPAFIHNSAGFRNTEEFDIQKPEGTLRILCIGHSVLYSGIADTPGGEASKPVTNRLINSFLKLELEKIPSLAGKHIEVINAGLNLASLEEMTSLFMNDLASYDPDIVLIFGSSNHVQIGSRVGPPFTSHLWRLNSRQFELVANDDSWRGLLEKSFRCSIYYSAFLSIFYRACDRLLPKIIQDKPPMREGSVVPNRGWTFSPEDLHEKIERQIAFLSAIHSFCDAKGIKPFLFWEYYLVNLDGVKPFSARERELCRFYRDQPDGGWTNTEQYFTARDEIKRVLGQKMTIIDLYEDFKTYGQTVFNDYLHYSEEGNRWVASRIAPYLKQTLIELTDNGRTD